MRGAFHEQFPKYALYDFDDGTVATGLICLIDIASAEISAHELWEKSTEVEENSCPVYPGGGATQSRRLKAKKQCGTSEEKHGKYQTKKNSSNSAVLTPKPPNKPKRLESPLIKQLRW